MTAFFQTPSQSSSTEHLLPPQVLLSAPLPQPRLKDDPFKPEDGDQTSLNMKKRKHRHHIWSRTLLHGDQNLYTQSQYKGSRAKGRLIRSRPKRSLSWPSIQPRFTHDTVELLSSANAQSQARRWTIPTKAPSTRGLAAIIPVRAAARTHVSSDGVQSPAMITLRRATTSRGGRRTSLTSFPTPTFSRQRSGIIATFLSSFPGNERSAAGAKLTVARIADGDQRPRSASISSNEAKPCLSLAAPVICTELRFVDAPVVRVVEGHDLYPMRRCSTRFVSDENVYEVIWDDDDFSTASEGREAQALRADNGSPIVRRRSSAIDQLQAQLLRASEQSRRGSTQDGPGETTTTRPDQKKSVQDGSKGSVKSSRAALSNSNLMHNVPPPRVSRDALAEDQGPTSTRASLQRTRNARCLRDNIDQDQSSRPVAMRASTASPCRIQDKPASSVKIDDRRSGIHELKKKAQDSVAGGAQPHCAGTIDVKTHVKLLTPLKNCKDKP